VALVYYSVFYMIMDFNAFLTAGLPIRHYIMFDIGNKSYMSV